MRKAAKLIRLLLIYCNPLNLTERFFIKRNNAKHHPPIFILGAPRSGTTFLYQLLTYHYKLSYFSNFSSLFVKSPASFSFISRIFFKTYNDKNLSSDYGLIKGLWAPSEAGKIFKNWFLKKDSHQIKDSINCMSNIFKAPFIAKNLRINAELKYIHQLYPDALFIHIKRDIAFNAQSLILGIDKNKSDIVGNIMINKQRKKITHGSREEIIEQVIDDIKSINETISFFLDSTNVNSISIDYNSLCENYENELKRVESVFEENGLKLKRKIEPFDLQIKASKRNKLSNEDLELLKALIENHK